MCAQTAHMPAFLWKLLEKEPEIKCQLFCIVFHIFYFCMAFESISDVEMQSQMVLFIVPFHQLK